MKPYSKMTPREHIVDTVVSRIKYGHAADAHAAIEGYVAEQHHRYPDSAKSSVYDWYANSTYEQRERLIREIERKAGIAKWKRIG